MELDSAYLTPAERLKPQPDPEAVVSEFRVFLNESESVIVFM
jgi:hypothetical protein